MPRVRRPLRRFCVGIISAVVTAGPVAAQTGEGHRHASTPPRAAGGASGKDADAADPTHAVHHAMSGTMSVNPHMRMSPERVASAADSARAERLVGAARSALAKYKDVRVAEREGYRLFAPNVKNQPVYHFTKPGSAVRERFAFD